MYGNSSFLPEEPVCSWAVRTWQRLNTQVWVAVRQWIPPKHLHSNLPHFPLLKRSWVSSSFSSALWPVKDCSLHGFCTQVHSNVSIDLAGTGTAPFPHFLHSFEDFWPTCLTSNRLLLELPWEFHTDRVVLSFFHGISHAVRAPAKWKMLASVSLVPFGPAELIIKFAEVINAVLNAQRWYVCSFGFQRIFGEITVVVHAWKRSAADHTGLAFILMLFALLSLRAVLAPAKSMQYKWIHLEL